MTTAKKCSRNEALVMLAPNAAHRYEKMTGQILTITDAEENAEDWSVASSVSSVECVGLPSSLPAVMGGPRPVLGSHYYTSLHSHTISDFAANRLDANYMKSHASLQNQCRQKFSIYPYLPSVYTNIERLYEDDLDVVFFK